MSLKPLAFNALMRRDLASFVAKTFQIVDGSQHFLPNWHIEVLAHYLDLARQRKIKRLIITLPPRHLKSICASVAFTAWALGHDPSLKIICASYSQDLASKHARDTRLLMLSPAYQSAFPGTKLKGSRPAEDELETTRGGYRLATSVGGTLTSSMIRSSRKMPCPRSNGRPSRTGMMALSIRA